MKVLNIYVIHSTYLVKRLKYINATIDMLKKITEEIGFTTNIVLITNPSKDEIETNIETYNKKVNYDKEIGIKADEQFNNSITSLNAFQISNTEKHRIAYERIKNASDELHFIIEDDVLIGEDYIANIKSLFNSLKNDSFDTWDILFTAIADIEKNPVLTLKDTRKQYKFILSKSSYFITCKLAKQLQEYLEVYKYNLKTAISKYIWDNKDVKSCILNKHTFLEGSKMGLFTTSINNSNFLYQNSQFVALAKITTNNEITDAMLEEANELYKQLEKLENPDVLHIMGVLHYKRQEFERAKYFMSEACYKMLENQGYYSKSSEILNNAINIFQYDQNLLEECKNKTAKYNPNTKTRY